MKKSLATPPAQPTILLVDDMDACRITMKWFLANFDYCVVAARSAEEAASIFNPSVHDLVLTDNSMPGMTGAELAHFVKERSPSTLVMMYTGKPPTDQSDLDMVIQKPTHLLLVKEAIDKLLKQLESP
jgi:DNA-binding NtrC family response regulator